MDDAEVVRRQKLIAEIRIRLLAIRSTDDEVAAQALEARLRETLDA